MPAPPSILRLKSKQFRRRPRSIVPAIDAMLASLEAIPVSRNWPLELKSQHRTLLRKARKRAAYLERLQAKRAANYNVIQWQRKAGAKLAQTRDLNAQLAWLLNRQHRARNLYAMAQGKRTFFKLGREHYQRIGRLGAAARWHKQDGAPPTGIP